MNGVTPLSQTNPWPLAVLRRAAGRQPPSPDGERCEMCAEPITSSHQHIVSLENRTLMCACRGCYLLFTDENADMRYRAVPDRYVSFPSFSLGSAQWDALEIPVGLAFFFRNSIQHRMVAFYPGPAGAAESELPLGAWDQVAAANPDLAVLRADVEALLIRMPDRQGAAVDCHLVPIDSCYELVGQMRQTWRGFDGGQDARAVMDVFFATVGARSRPVRSVDGR